MKESTLTSSGAVPAWAKDMTLVFDGQEEPLEMLDEAKHYNTNELLKEINRLRKEINRLRK